MLCESLWFITLHYKSDQEKRKRQRKGGRFDAEISLHTYYEWKNDPSSGSSTERQEQSLNLDGGGL